MDQLHQRRADVEENQTDHDLTPICRQFIVSIPMETPS